MAKTKNPKKIFISHGDGDDETEYEVQHYVRRWRMDRGLTQQALAAKTPYTHGAISQLETGRTEFTQAMLFAIAKALGCKPHQLLEGGPEVAEARNRIMHDFDRLDEEDKIRIALIMEAFLARYEAKKK